MGCPASPAIPLYGPDGLTVDLTVLSSLLRSHFQRSCPPSPPLPVGHDGDEVFGSAKAAADDDSVINQRFAHHELKQVVNKFLLI